MSRGWISRFRPRREARLRLFLFPYAGGGASLYRGWSNAFPSEVDVLPVQLPGREDRLAEPAFRHLDPLADAAAEALLPLADRPVALFGWSMGAAVAHAVAQRWERAGRPPALLIAAASPAPHLPNTLRPIHALPSADFWQAVAGLGGLPEEVMASDELLRFVEPTLRADFAVVESRAVAHPHALGCPIVAIAADEDRTVPLANVRAWSLATRGHAAFAAVAGGHFVIRDHPAGVRTAVQAALTACVPAARPRSMTLRDLALQGP
jgi:medium-chain acyl-[acyl-carrier-protein] hydrolase